MSKSTLSCCLAAHNEENKLPIQLEAIFETSIVSPDQLVFLDDGSTDNTYDILNMYAKKYEFCPTIIQRNQTPSEPPRAFNQAASLATEDWLYLASANDELDRNAFHYWEEAVEEFPNSVLVVGGISWSDRLEFFDSEEALKAMRLTQGINGGHVFIRRDIWEAYGGYNTNLRFYCDMFLYHVIALRHGCVSTPHKITKLSPYKYSDNVKDPEQAKKVAKIARDLLNTVEYDDVREKLLSIYAWKEWLKV